MKHQVDRHADDWNSEKNLQTRTASPTSGHQTDKHTSGHLETFIIDDSFWYGPHQIGGIQNRMNVLGEHFLSSQADSLVAREMHIQIPLHINHKSILMGVSYFSTTNFAGKSGATYKVSLAELELPLVAYFCILT